ncbi:MAG: glycerol kinase GlpK [Deltaproteobacteria bacterium]|nr:glycerol kinase GlpK [Deltaproteobacteria bacterium]
MILAIDQGTTGTTALLIDKDIHIIDKVTVDFPQIFPQSGWVEHNLNDIWQSTLLAIQKLLEKTKINPKKIDAIGITNQRETTCVWNQKTGKPLHNAIVWQCRRSASFCNKLKKEGLNPFFQKKTGLLLDAYFSGTKINWLLKNVSKTKEKNAVFGTIDSFLISKLTNNEVHITDVSNASRTLLMNIKTLEWDDELCKILKIPKDKLPHIKSNCEIYGKTKNVAILPDGIPISSAVGDQQAALFGQACFKENEAKCTYGTGSFFLLNTGKKPVFSKNNLLTTVAWHMKNKTTYALEGSVFIAGAAVQWLRDGLKIIRSSKEIEELAKKVPTSEEVVFVPALTGLGAPYWNQDARGAFYGLTRGTTQSHIARATLEAIAFQNYDLVKTMEKDTKKTISILRVDGGASANNLLMNFQAGLLNIPLSRPESLESTARGAALLAGLAIGYWNDLKEIAKKSKTATLFKPKMKEKERKQHLSKWHKAIQRTLT